MILNKEEKERYIRQIILPDFGEAGQAKLLKAKVLVVGLGGLGSPAALYLAAAGVGEIGLVDQDKVELNNLHRQILFSVNDIGQAKVKVGQKRLQDLNPDLKINQYYKRVTASNIMEIFRDYDLIIDGSDNFPTKYLLNDAAVLTNKPLIRGAFSRYEGEVMTIVPEKGACYRCLFPEPPLSGTVPNCQMTGVLGALAGTIGMIQASEGLKYFLQIGELLAGKMLIYNALDMSFRKISIPKNEACPLCGQSPTITTLTDFPNGCQ